MARKFSKEQLRERAVVQRLEFTRERHAAMLAELDWATNARPMPAGMTTPPAWVKVAILAVVETTLRPLFERDPKIPSNLSRANLMQLAAMGVSSAAALQQALCEIQQHVGDAPKVRSALLRLEDVTTPALGNRAASTARRPQKRTPSNHLITPQQYQEDLKNQAIGASAFIDHRGELTKGQSIKAQLYGLLWFFWPLLTRIENVRQMREALQTVNELQPSQKSLEAVCTKVGIFSGKRGRPAKKILRGTEGA